MQPLRVLAAGSLRPVWSAMAEHFRNEYPPGIETQFGPAGLLRQRIEQGESCDLFASANLAHPQALRQSGRALQVAAFCRNSLCLNVRRELGNLSWLQLLQHPQLRIATSTAGSDPCGDYAWQMFDRLALWDSELGENLRQRARMVVGGEHSPAIPPGMQAASWIIESDQADIFIGYSSYGHRREHNSRIATVSIPQEWQPSAIYGFAVCDPRAQPLGDFLLSEEAQAILRQYGFGAAGA
ncbi:substrate-binding domain-containing protein [Erwinia sp. SLM-02]|uniref:substrate-binding domain-containing protein n=1 Tax=Erwinia sp. SLM-02 TaxID=3020057 RepID=UPI003080839D